MNFTASQIALLINGKIEGNPNASVHSFGRIEEAEPGQLAFLANLKYEDYLYSTQASVVIINESLQLKQNVSPTLVRVPDAYTAFATLLAKYQEMVTQQMNGVQQPSYIAKTATYGENVRVGSNTKIFPGVFLGDNVKIGNGTIIHPGVKIYKECIIGDHVTIHAGTVIGSDGFGFAPQADGSFKKVPQIGNVVIENDVEIGAM